MHGTVDFCPQQPGRNQMHQSQNVAKVLLSLYTVIETRLQHYLGIIWNTTINCLDEQNVIAETRLRFENFKNPETELGRYLLIVKIGRYNA